MAQGDNSPPDGGGLADGGGSGIDLSNLKHPYATDDDGTRIVPAQAEDSTPYDCPTEGCNNSLWARGPSKNGTVRHFAHSGGSGGSSCNGRGGGGENEDPIHELYSSHAASELQRYYGDPTTDSTMDFYEVVVGVDDDLPSGNDWRKADALATFDEPHPTLGKGLAVEIQNKHDDKDISVATEDYHSLGYSVAWVDVSEFKHNGLQLSQSVLEDRAKAVWPLAVPEKSEWRSKSDDYRTIRTRIWYESVYNTPNPSTKVRLPPEWYDEREYEVWQASQSVREGKTADMLLDDIRDILSSSSGSTNVNLPPEYYDEWCYELWQTHGYLRSGRADELALFDYLDSLASSNSIPTSGIFKTLRRGWDCEATFWIGKWTADNNEVFLWRDGPTDPGDQRRSYSSPTHLRPPAEGCLIPSSLLDPIVTDLERVLPSRGWKHTHELSGEEDGCTHGRSWCRGSEAPATYQCWQCWRGEDDGDDSSTQEPPTTMA